MTSLSGPEPKRSKYRLLGLVGQGQFGRVFCAIHRQTGRLVALKNLERQRFSTHKFLRELRFLLSLQHPNIVTCQALEHTSTGRYLVMDYCEGGTLRQLMTEENWLSLPQSIAVIAHILAGLEHAHSREIVHCDIKPENILLNVHPEGWTARISDFGIARLRQELADPELGNTGSPAYMAPERFYGQYSVTSDLYSVGILLFELIAGYRPFSGTPSELMSAHLNRPVKIPDSIPSVWHSIIYKALQKLSARRFRSASDMLVALKTAAAAAGIHWQGDRPSLTVPLLQSTATYPICEFVAQYQESLHQPITTLMTRSHFAESSPLSPNRVELFAAHMQQVGYQSWSSLESASLVPEQNTRLLTSLPSDIRALLPYPQGCLVVTRQAIYRIPNAVIGNDAQLLVSPQGVVSSEQGLTATLEARGQWLAWLSQSEKAEECSLSFRALGSGLSYKLAEMVRIPTPPSATLPQIFALDSRHLAVVIECPSHSATFSDKVGQTSSSGTLIKIVTRRGTRLGSLLVPLRLMQICLALTPYRLLAVDQDDPQSLVIIDLKPYRLLRIGLPLKPTLLTATPWGYLLAEASGQIMLLDQDRHKIGQIASPEPITAITSMGRYNFLIATWKNNHGNLFSLDMRALDVDLVF